MHGLAVDTANACATACTAVDTAKHTTRDHAGPGAREQKQGPCRHSSCARPCVYACARRLKKTPRSGRFFIFPIPSLSSPSTRVCLGFRSNSKNGSGASDQGPAGARASHANPDATTQSIVSLEGVNTPPSASSTSRHTAVSTAFVPRGVYTAFWVDESDMT